MTGKAKSIKRIFTRRILPVALAAAVVAGVAEWQNLRYLVRAEEVTSLPRIEDIKKQIADGATFNITEIVTDDDTDGIFGYYIKGQEPDDFVNTLTKTKGHNARTRWAYSHLNRLQEAGILSTEKDKAPLYSNYSDLYKEEYPWVKPESDDFTALSLAEDESIKVKADATDDEEGDFSLDTGSFSVSANGAASGRYRQYLTEVNPIENVSLLFKDDADYQANKSSYVFYKPQFTQITRDDAEDTLATYNKKLEIYEYEVTNEVFYQNEGKLVYDEGATNDLEFRSGGHYYMITGLTGLRMGKDMTETTLSELEANGWYGAAVDITRPFVRTKGGENGYFSLVNPVFRYVGDKQGMYKLSNINETAGGDTTIIYDTINYKGGYTNNNWFLRHIFDYGKATDSELDDISQMINVSVVSAQGDGKDLNLDSDGLVVIDSGLTDKGVMLSEGVRKAVSEYSDETNKGAVLADMDALESDDDPYTTLHLEDTNSNNVGDNPDGLVHNGVFAFRERYDRSKVTTSALLDDYEDDEYKEKSSPFGVVYDEIATENFLRKQRDPATDDLLYDGVRMSSVIRYIINYKTQRNVAKDKISILDIEPEETSEIVDKNGKIADQVLKWFGNQYTRDQISVTTMSTRELNGVIDDLSAVRTVFKKDENGKYTFNYENYDALYIGAGTNFKVDQYGYISYENGGNEDFNDKDMRGLIYYNIGDTVTLDQSTKITTTDKSAVTAGLKVSDFKTAKQKITYRYSGNDLNKRSQKALDGFIKTGRPVIVSGMLMDNDTMYGHTGQAVEFGKPYSTDDGCTYELKDGKWVLTAQPFIPVGQIGFNSYRFQWYRLYTDESGNTIKEKVSGADSNVYTVPVIHMSDGSKYFCTITKIVVSRQAYYPIRGKIDPKDSNELAGTRVAPASKTFVISKDKVEITDTVGEPSTGHVHINGSTAKWVRTKTVDHCSKMFDLLYNNSKTENLWLSDADDKFDDYFAYGKGVKASQDSTNVLRHLAISSPRIEFEENGCPAQYTEGMSTSDYLGDTMTLNFRIVNPTDTTPDETTYTATLYFDVNGDGLFSEGEQVSDIFASGDSSDPVNYASQLTGNLTFEKAKGYSLAVVLPDQMQGVINWKLQVTENAGIRKDTNGYMPHAVFQEVSYKSPAENRKPDTINVLQINSDSQGASRYNLEKTWLAHGGAAATKDKDGVPTDDSWIGNYGTYLNKEIVTKKYNMNFVTVSAKEFNDRVYSKDRSRTVGGVQFTTTAGKRIDINDYDMVVLGFSDDYRMLDLQACTDIKTFAKNGKSVLFTHDNSSFGYLPTSKSTYKFSDDFFHMYNPNVDPETRVNAYGAFNFNTILRSFAQMDVYGITDSDLGSGGVGYWKNRYSSWPSGFLATQDDDVSEEAFKNNEKKLTDAGYSVAYKPESIRDNRTQYNENVHIPRTITANTEGFSDYLLKRFGSGKDKMYDAKTQNVSQINRGTITSYPYDINAAGGDEYMNVSDTHAQYNQLNLNSDDIVVWYTVENAKGESFYRKHDAGNNYYLYSCRNIYYTGAGHSNQTPPTAFEAKLFINTMIAAYRAGGSLPKAYFTASQKSRKQVNSYVVSSGDNVTSALDAFRRNLEEVTGVDTSSYTEEQFLKLQPAKEFADVYDDEDTPEHKKKALETSTNMVDLAAMNAVKDLAVNYRREGDTSGVNNRAQAITGGPAYGGANEDQTVNGCNVKFHYLNTDSTVQQIVDGIDRVVTGTENQHASIVSDKSMMESQYLYFIINDNNLGNGKRVEADFYSYSKTKRDDDSSYFYDEEYKAWYKNINSEISIYDPDTDDVNSSLALNLKANTIYKMKIPATVLKELANNGKSVITIQPKTYLNGNTYRGKKINLNVQRVGFLNLG